MSMPVPRTTPDAVAPLLRSRVASLVNGPWLTLAYLVFVFIPLLFAPRLPALAWPLSLVSVAVFVPIHLFAWQHGREHAGGCIGAVIALGLALLPFNPGGNTYIIYAMAMSGALLTPRRALLVSLLAWLLMSLAVLLLDYPQMIAVAYSGITLVIGGLALAGTAIDRMRQRQNAALQMSQDEVSRLAALAERERIGRDLHDLLGHTLSLVVLKSELAGKLFERNPALARQQVAEVEQIARQALTEVRQAVSGYRQNSLASELANCRLALLDAGVALQASMPPVPLAPAVEAALALALREAITNVIRHADARRVDAELRKEGDALLLTIHDDGRGGIRTHGNGLTGMRERLAAIDAELDIDSPAGGGSRLSIRVAPPWQLPAAALDAR